MIDLKNLPPDLVKLLKDKFNDKLDDLQIPPTAFTSMNGELIEYDIEEGRLKTKFPVMNEHLNQFGNMQGGMIAAAIDNTLGPLSMIVAEPNFTRQLDIKYKKIIIPEVGYIFVEAFLSERKNRQILFSANVFDENKTIFATARAVHWILKVSP